MAATALMVGLCLYENIPTLRRLAITMISRGLGLSWIAGFPDSGYQEVATSFLRTMTAATKSKVIFKAIHCSIRTIFSDSRKACTAILESADFRNTWISILRRRHPDNPGFCARDPRGNRAIKLESKT